MICTRRLKINFMRLVTFTSKAEEYPEPSQTSKAFCENSERSSTNKCFCKILILDDVFSLLSTSTINGFRKYKQTILFFFISDAPLDVIVI